jgi:hypothetical protein
VSLPLANNFESGQPNGTVITVGNSGGGAGNAWDAITGSAAYRTTTPFDGTLCGSFPIAVGGAFCNVRWSTSLGTQTHVYGRCFLFFTTLTNITNTRFVNATSSAQVALNSTGKFRVFDSTGANVLSTTVLSPSTWYRFDWELIASTTVGLITAAAYLGNSTSPIETISLAGANTNSNFTQILYGLTSGEETGAVTIVMDDISVQSTPFQQQFLMPMSVSGQLRN